MGKIIWGVGGFLLYSVLLSSLFCSGIVADPAETCQSRNVSYNIADTKQCDKYHECTKSGKMFERLCDDGFVFSTEIHACEYPHNVDCSERPALQEPKSTNKDCPRMNGLYPFPPDISCQKFYHCLEGRAYEKSCPEGVIFDPSKGACIHPDLSKRKDCAAREVLNFTCPNFGKKFVRLRFGDHERVSHPTDCRKFFICLADGKPRVGGCPLGKVFNPKLGMCDSPKRVPQCKDYYGKRDPAKLAKLAELGEEGSLLLQDEENTAEIESTADDEEPHTHESPEEEQSHQHHQPQTEHQPKKNKKTFAKRQASLTDAANSAVPVADSSAPSQSQGQNDKSSSQKNQQQPGSQTDDEDSDLDDGDNTD